MSYPAMCPICGAECQYPNRPGDFQTSPTRQVCDKCAEAEEISAEESIRMDEDSFETPGDYGV